MEDFITVFEVMSGVLGVALGFMFLYRSIREDDETLSLLCLAVALLFFQGLS